MYICICNAVSDRDIRRCVAQDGARSVRDLKRELGVATQCCQCAKAARGVLKEALAGDEANGCTFAAAAA
ncbi:MAG: (2Fe-2S)-binding protein [Burkholderiales bacterium]